MNQHVDILLATYNGERFLPAQLDSLLAQTHGNWRLLVRDDGSTDGTTALLADYARRQPERIVVRQNERNLGIRATFNLLLAEAEADHILLCDQDDVWLPEKVERTLALAQAAAARCGRETPLLVHTDLRVVDGDLNPIADSLWRYQNCDPGTGRRLNRLLLQNPATGCTVLVNRALRDLALPVPAAAVMHDWWLALTAAVFGRVEHLAEPTVLYRQHGRNDTGAQPWNAGYLRRRCAEMVSVRTAMFRPPRQAAAFLERFGDGLDERTAAMLRAFSTLGEQGFWTKRRSILRHGLWYSGTMRNLGWLVMA